MNWPSDENADSLTRVGDMASLIARAIQCICQERYAEALQALDMRGEQEIAGDLLPQAEIAAFSRCYTAYDRARSRLCAACKDFCEAEELVRSQALLLLEDLRHLVTQGDVTRVPQRDQQQAPQTSDDHVAQVSLSVQQGTKGTDQPLPEEKLQLPALSIACFGRFSVTRLDKEVTLCNNRNGQAILRYLVAQKGYRASVDELADALWPGDELAVARCKLQVAARSDLYTDVLGPG
jgi:hypothetical protein